MASLVIRLHQGEAIIRRWSTALAIIAGVAMIALVLMVSTDIFRRFAFNRPIPGGVEISQLIMPWAIFLGFAYALAVGTHVQMTLIMERFPRLRIWLQSWAHIVGLIFAGLVTLGSWIYFWKSVTIGETMLSTINLPWYVGKVALPIGMFVFALQFLVLLALYLTQLFSRKE